MDIAKQLNRENDEVEERQIKRLKIVQTPPETVEIKSDTPLPRLRKLFENFTPNGLHHQEPAKWCPRNPPTRLGMLFPENSPSSSSSLFSKTWCDDRTAWYAPQTINLDRMRENRVHLPPEAPLHKALPISQPILPSMESRASNSSLPLRKKSERLNAHASESFSTNFVQNDASVDMEKESFSDTLGLRVEGSVSRIQYPSSVPIPPRIPISRLLNRITIELTEATSFENVPPSGPFFLGRPDRSKMSGLTKPSSTAQVVVSYKEPLDPAWFEKNAEIAVLAQPSSHKQGFRLHENVANIVTNNRGPIISNSTKQRVLLGGDCIGLLSWGDNHEIGTVYVSSTGYLTLQRGTAMQDKGGEYMYLPNGAHFDVKKVMAISSATSTEPEGTLAFTYYHALSCNESSLMSLRGAKWMVDGFILRILLPLPNGKYALGQANFQMFSDKIARKKLKREVIVGL